MKILRFKKKYDIILILCPPWDINYPPTGINYLKGYTEKAGFNIKLIDINLELFKKYKKLRKYWRDELKENWTDPEKFTKLYSYFSSDINKIINEVSSKTSVVGFSAYQDNIRFILTLAEKLKKIGIKIIVGGPSCYVERERKLLKNGAVDYIIIGEGEKPLTTLLRTINKKNPPTIPGVLIPKNKESYIPQSQLDLDSLTWSKNMDPGEYDNKDTISLLLTKGCIGNCTFCNDKNLMGGEFRARNSKQVYEEIKYYHKKKINNFIFNDLLINGDIYSLTKLCDLIIRDKKLTINMVANAIPMKNLTKKTLTKLSSAGFNTLIFGIETGSDEVLKDMKKYFTIRTAENVLKTSKEVDINNWINLMVGYPTETEDDFNMTLSFLERNKENIDRIHGANMCNILYNSTLMNKKEEYDIILPANEYLTEVMWHTKDKKNTYDIRKRRLKILMDKIKELGLEIKQTNYHAFEEYV